MDNQLTCKNCGKVCKTTHTLELHQIACDAKYAKKEVKKEVVETTEPGLVETNTVEDLNSKDGEKEIVIKTEKEILKDEIREFINTIKLSRVTPTQANKIMTYYHKITGKPKQNIQCASCLSHCWKTLLLNV